VADWPLVILKELIDNALDACEDANIAPVVHIVIDARGIAVKDNGPGIPAGTVERLCDFAVRVSSREAYVAPTRGAQGNALKTLLAMPYALGATGTAVGIAAKGLRHSIAFRVDHIRGQPVVDLRTVPDRIVKTGTLVEVAWPDSARSQLDDVKDRILQIASDFGWLNPSLTLILDWFGDKLISHKATNRDWPKWKPSDPQPPFWYSLERFQRRIAAYVSNDAANGRSRTVREFVAEFRGLSSSAKGAAVLAATGLGGAQLADLVNDEGFDEKRTTALLKAMQGHSKPVKPAQLGSIGRAHFEARFKVAGCEMESFDYRKVEDHDEGGIPFLVEVAFGWLGDAAPQGRRLVTGVNWSPGIVNPFRQLGGYGQSLDSILAQQRVGRDEPVIFVLHAACPRVDYLDRGKSSIAVQPS
jgi:DNA topoisomerase VI subunit B